MHCEDKSQVGLQHKIRAREFFAKPMRTVIERERRAETFPLITTCRPDRCQHIILVSFTWEHIANATSLTLLTHMMSLELVWQTVWSKKAVLYFRISVVFPVKQKKPIYVCKIFNCQLCFWDCPSHSLCLNEPKLVHWWPHIISITFFKSLLALNDLSWMLKKETGLISMGFQKARF